MATDVGETKKLNEEQINLINLLKHFIYDKGKHKGDNKDDYNKGGNKGGNKVDHNKGNHEGENKDDHNKGDDKDDKLNNLTRTRLKNAFYLLGGPGVGKTYTISTFITTFMKNNKVIICTPTNKALNVIQKHMHKKMTKNTPNGCNASIRGCRTKARSASYSSTTFQTIHKVLQVKNKIDEHGEEKFVVNNKATVNCDVIIIDESSMINKELYEGIKNIMKTKKIIFIGDKDQLPPINEDESMIFSDIEDNYKYMYKLKQIMRTNNEVLMKVYEEIRKWKFDPHILSRLSKIQNDNLDIKYYIQHADKNPLKRCVAFCPTPLNLKIENKMIKKVT